MTWLMFGSPVVDVELDPRPPPCRGIVCVALTRCNVFLYTLVYCDSSWLREAQRPSGSSYRVGD